jgi:hypothetical protein
MATKKEKEQLMATLKFTPRNYRIEIWGRGGEVYYGTVDRKIYDFFKEKEIDIEQYAGGWDDSMWSDVPEDLRPFPPGSPYDCDHGCHTSGATLDESSYITVYDETGEQIWQSSLSSINLAKEGVGFECNNEYYPDDQPEGTVLFMGAQGEKGLFFGDEFELKAPFDPSKLTIFYEDIDGWELTSGVSYDGEDIDGNDYDTTGKWGENKWIIIGGEEVYDGVERDEDLESNDEEEWDPAAELDKIEVPKESIEETIDAMAEHLEDLQNQLGEIVDSKRWPN